MALSFNDAKQIPISEYLSRLGIEPAKIRGQDYWYHSPFRHERTASLKVNITLNLWYDHGSGEGGTIVDLGAKIHRCTPNEFLEKLSDNYFELKRSVVGKKDAVQPDNKVEVIATGELSNRNLLKYVQNRGVSTHFACEHCQQVEFAIANKKYTAIGFKNRSGGYELRNNWFKGSSSPKDVTLIENGSESLCVLEGFMDFLSVLTLNHRRIFELPVKCDFLILNSLSFVNKNIPLLQRKDNILFLDNDQAGTNAKTLLVSNGIKFRDASSLYAPSKDVNEYLKAMAPVNVAFSKAKGLRN